MKPLFAAVALLALAAGCSPKTEKVADVSEPTPAQESVANAKRMPLPDCGSVQAEDTGAGWKNVDCRLVMTDGPYAFEARYTPSDKPGVAPTVVTIQVVQPGDATIQTITESVENTFNAPSLQDLDSDKYQELLVPLMTGNVNTSYAIWHGTSAGPEFKRLGEVSAFGFERTESGYVAALARGGANMQSVSFLKIVDGQLKPIATAEMTAQGEADKITGVDCIVTDDGGFKDEGLTAETGKAKFCAEPLAKGAFE